MGPANVRGVGRRVSCAYLLPEEEGRAQDRAQRLVSPGVGVQLLRREFGGRLDVDEEPPLLCLPRRPQLVKAADEAQLRRRPVDLCEVLGPLGQAKDFAVGFVACGATRSGALAAEVTKGLERVV